MSYYEMLNDKELVNLLFTEQDRLSRKAVDECIRRGERMIKPLNEIVSKEMYWTEKSSAWWAVVHAVFILGAIDTKEAVLPLIRALRRAEAYDIDWIITELPSIFGKLGIPAIDELKKLVLDVTNDWQCRSTAMMSLAAITIHHPETEADIFSLIYSILINKEEDFDTRESAGNVLLDFSRSEYKESLLAFCEEEKKFREEGKFKFVAFNEDDVYKTFSTHKKDLYHYTKDWLSFYNEAEIKKRQERWKMEEEEELEFPEEYNEISEAFIREIPKIGRNEPCPCGSGKKYKKCCMKGQG